MQLRRRRRAFGMAVRLLRSRRRAICEAYRVFRAALQSCGAARIVASTPGRVRVARKGHGQPSSPHHKLAALTARYTAPSQSARLTRSRLETPTASCRHDSFNTSSVRTTWSRLLLSAPRRRLRARQTRRRARQTRMRPRLATSMAASGACGHPRAWVRCARCPCSSPSWTASMDAPSRGSK